MGDSRIFSFCAPLTRGSTRAFSLSNAMKLERRRRNKSPSKEPQSSPKWAYRGPAQKIEDRALLRKGIAALVGAEPDMKRVAEASSGEEAPAPDRSRSKFDTTSEPSVCGSAMTESGSTREYWNRGRVPDIGGCDIGGSRPVRTKEHRSLTDEPRPRNPAKNPSAARLKGERTLPQMGGILTARSRPMATTNELSDIQHAGVGSRRNWVQTGLRGRGFQAKSIQRGKRCLILN